MHVSRRTASHGPSPTAQRAATWHSTCAFAAQNSSTDAYASCAGALEHPAATTPHNPTQEIMVLMK
jgi:hypothetical protein